MGAGMALESPQAELWIFRARAPCTWSGGIPPPHLTGTWGALSSLREARQGERKLSLLATPRGLGAAPCSADTGRIAREPARKGFVGRWARWARRGALCPGADCCPSPARAQASPGSCTSGSSL